MLKGRRKERKMKENGRHNFEECYKKKDTLIKYNDEQKF